MDGGAAYSAASTSKTWIERNFDDRYSSELAKTAYVTGNPFSEQLRSRTDIGFLDEVWRYAWDNERGTIPPRPLTDRLISIGRQNEWERLIVHYMQPHFPALENPKLGGQIDINNAKSSNPDSIWRHLQEGKVTSDEVWAAYETNLKSVLEDVELLLNNVDADTAVITSDHGNAIGDWGFYGHKEGIPLQCMRRVPWCETNGTDSHEYVPQTYDRDDEVDTSVEERLSSLGYQ
ncbi:hypothetical protein VB773_02115 [Haloarculaceae archaeon H-GB2-1]|nr:hypothetical protein [Haloarculaceae archaeon H-GB11]MEA5406492.1 hypothetical protein [Haloarculaceae archaeon H-GB2-1]